MTAKTTFSEADFIEILSNYHLGDYLRSEEFPHGTVQTNLCMHTTQGKFAFRCYENRTVDSVSFEISLLQYLQAYQFPTPAPIENRDGHCVGRHAGKPYVIFNFIEGKHLDDPQPTHEAELIRHIATLHIITRSYEPAHLEARWNYSISFCWERAQIESTRINTPNATKKLNWLKAELDQLTIPDTLPKGICHCDLHFQNVLFHQDKIAGLLDFDDANYTFLLYDLVHLTDSWAWHDNHVDFPKARGLVQAYTQHRKLENEEKKHIYDMYKLQVLIDCVWFFERGNADDFYEKRKMDYLNDLGRDGFYDRLFRE